MILTFLRFFRGILSVLDLIMIATNQLPLPLFQGSFYWQVSRVIEVSVSLGLFDSLSETPKHIDELAKELSLDVYGLKTLLGVLSILGYVRETPFNSYAITKLSQKWLTDRYHSNVQPMITATQNLRKRWQALEETIRNGLPTEDTYTYFAQHPDEAKVWHLALSTLAFQIGPIITRKIRFNNSPRRLLDLGGSHGVFSASFCHAYPEMEATIFDLPQGVEVGTKLLAELNCTKRINFITGNFWFDELAGPYDVILLFNIIHANSNEQNILLLTKCQTALSNGGYIIILDQLTGTSTSPLGELIASLVSLNLFNETGGKVYDYPGVVHLLQNSGLKLIQYINLLAAPGNAIFVTQVL